MRVDYLGYEEAVEQSYLGVASIRLYLEDFGAILLNFKIQNNKDGINIFVASPSYKKTVDGQDVWREWFSLDSRSQNDEVLTLIRSKVKEYYAAKKQDVKPTSSGQGPWGPPPSEFDQPSNGFNF